jgi:hypothetical protein
MTTPPSNTVQSTDLVDRLRDDPGVTEIYEAADEIERCHADIKSLMDQCGDQFVRIAELESNERAYEEIIGPMTYREVADRIKGLEDALRESLIDNCWNAYHCGITRDGKWMDGGMSDAEWLQRHLGMDDGWHDCKEIQRRIPEVVEKLIADIQPKAGS